MLIYYLSAQAGAGKTYSIVSEIERITTQGDRVILCQPTIKLIEETTAQLKGRFPLVDVKVIHGYGSVGDIMRYLNSPNPEPHALIVTWEAFQRLKFIPNKKTWRLIVDEIPQAYDCFDEILPETHTLLTDHLTIHPLEGDAYSIVFGRNQGTVRQIAENKSKDKALSVFQPLASRLASEHWISYVHKDGFERLCSSPAAGQRLTVFSFLRPSIFDGFKSVMIAGACFEASILYKSFMQRGVTFKVADHATRELRFTSHPNGSSVTFSYAMNHHWSKRHRDKEGRKAWAKIVNGVKEHFQDKPFIWSANKDMKDDLFGPEAAALRLPQSPHGLNTFSDVDNVAFLSAHNLIPAHAKFIEQHLLMSREEIQTAVHRQHAYQAIMRSSLRNPSNTNPKNIFVPDLATALRLQNMFDGAILQFLDFGLGLKPIVRGRKRIHETAADRTQVYRQRLKEQQTAHDQECMEALFPKASNPSLPHQKKCDENTINSSNNVTKIRASLFENKESALPYGIINGCSLEDFEGGLRGHSEEVFERKEDNHMISPSIFDPDKSNEHSRGNDNVVTANSIWLDFDSGDLTPKGFADLFPNLRMTIYNTFSSTKKDMRFRVFIPALSDMPLEVYRAITGHMLQCITDAGYGLPKRTKGDKRKAHGLDTGKLGPASLFYLPCQPADPSGKYFRIFKSKDRKALDVSEWIEKVEIREDAYEWEVVHDALTDASKVLRIEKAVAKWRNQSSTPGVGHHEFFVLAGALAGAGCDEGETASILEEEAMYANHPDQRRNEIRGNIASLQRKGAFITNRQGMIPQRPSAESHANSNVLVANTA